MMQTYNYVSNITDYIHNADYRPILAYKVVDVEVAVPVTEQDDYGSIVRHAISLCRAEVLSWATQGHFPFNGTLGFRFIKNSNAILSSALGNTHTVLVEMSNYYHTDLFEQFANSLYGKYLLAFSGARPHGPKGSSTWPPTQPPCVKRLGSSWTTFGSFVKSRALTQTTCSSTISLWLFLSRAVS
jgi:hypothetical protein